MIAFRGSPVPDFAAIMEAERTSAARFEADLIEAYRDLVECGRDGIIGLAAPWHWELPIPVVRISCDHHHRHYSGSLAELPNSPAHSLGLGTPTSDR